MTEDKPRGAGMWKLQIPDKGDWKDLDELVSGDAAKRRAAEHRRWHHVERFRILDPGGNPWMTGRWCVSKMKWKYV